LQLETSVVTWTIPWNSSLRVQNMWKWFKKYWIVWLIFIGCHSQNQIVFCIIISVNKFGLDCHSQCKFCNMWPNIPLSTVALNASHNKNSTISQCKFYNMWSNISLCTVALNGSHNKIQQSLTSEFCYLIKKIRT
jgi:hypothetical protein